MKSRFRVEEETAFYGRTFTEYRRLFDLDRSALHDATVLDCPGGPSAFAAVASALADSLTAVDPCYDTSPGGLADRSGATIDRFEDQLRDREDEFVWEFYGDVETRMRYARAAATRFLADYERHPERYVAGALPDLPFECDVFDLAFSANLLFLYDDRFDRSFHLRSLRELARVTRGELRVFPTANLAADRSSHLRPAVEALREDGLEVETRAVPYEFLPGVSEMLVVSEVEGYEPA